MTAATPVFLLAALLGAVSGQAVAAAEFDEAAVYRERVRQMQRPEAATLSIYDVMEDVPGAAREQPLPRRSPNERSPSAQSLDAARAYAASNNSNALLVWRDGALELEAYFGAADAGTPTISRSLSKPLTAIAIGRAIALGKIRSLDQPLVDFFTEWRGTYKETMLVRHLLDMRTGFLQQGPVDDPASIWTRTYLGTRHDEVLLAEYPLIHSPGTFYNYSNAPSELVAPLIERATGRRYAEFIGREILAPIGAPGGRVWVNRPGGMAHAGCCMTTPAQTWLRLAILLLEDGVWNGQRLLPDGYVAAMRTATRENIHAGLGVWLGQPYAERRGAGHPSLPGPKTWHSEPYLASDLYLFDGNANQVVYIIPSLRMIVLRTGDAPPRAPEWDNSVLPNLLIRGLRNP